MNWIRLSSEYPRHRKTLRLARMLGPCAPLYPILLWLWAVEQSADGSLRDLENAEIASIVGFDGDPDALWAALLGCGFVEEVRGERRLCSWYEYQGILLDRQRRNTERKRRMRAGGEDVGEQPAPPTPTLEHPQKAAESEFASLWEVCAKKVSKGQARKTYVSLRTKKKLPPIEELTRKLVAAQATEQWTREGRRYQPNLSTWLNAEGWDDQIDTTANSSAKCKQCGDTGFYQAGPAYQRMTLRCYQCDAAKKEIA